MTNADRRLKNHDRDLAALKLRQAGASYPVIAQQCGFNSRQAAHKAVQALLQRNEAEAVDEMRALDNSRYDALLMAVWRQALAGDKDAHAAALKVLERRAKLNGLDAPVRSEVAGLLNFTVDLGLEDDGDDQDRA